MHPDGEGTEIDENQKSQILGLTRQVGNILVRQHGTGTIEQDSRQPESYHCRFYYRCDLRFIGSIRDQEQ
ncbi:MAG: hypothetical protein A2Z38_06875 [Planctomycetes bacterium RBG_19FT_COMBO_48_8]|nr:MAG: hypothetical protein A2Z38_06875 [Planctomycetes bacterium RBG_19FT_COMBO_48_8]